MLGNIALQGTIKNRVLISWLPKSKNISLPSQRFILSIRISRKSKTYLKIIEHVQTDGSDSEKIGGENLVTLSS